MKTTPLAVFAFAMLTASSIQTASAGIYQWKDAQGRTVVSDVPPPRSTPQKSMETATPASREEAPAKEAPNPNKSLAERDMEFKKRQQEAKEKADKAAKEQAAVKDRQENCERAKAAQSALESGQRIATTNSKGEREFMDDAARQAELERAKRIVAESCK